MRWDDLEANVKLGDWSRALDLAADGWRKRRHPLLADLIDVLARKCQATPVRAAAKAAFQEEWLERAAAAATSKRASDLEPLLATLTRSIPFEERRYWAEGSQKRYQPWLKRLRALDALPTDPRIARAFLEVVRKAPWGSSYPSDTSIVYDPLLATIGGSGDTRLLPALRSLLDRPVASRLTIRQHLAQKLPQTIEDIERSELRQKPLEAAEIERCERLIDSLGGRVVSGPVTASAGANADEEEGLLELVLESFEDDAPREVIADYWLERGDPRGTFVTTQLRMSRSDGEPAEDDDALYQKGTIATPGTTDDHKTIRALLRKHEKTWLSELALVTKTRIWRRGFLDEVELLQNAAADPKTWEAAAASPLLRTLRVIHKGKANEAHYRSFLFSPMMRSLREMTIVSKAHLTATCERAEPWAKLEHLIVGTFMPNKRAIATLEEGATRLPALEGVTFAVTKGNVDKLIPLAASFAKSRRLTYIDATPLRWYEDVSPLADWLVAVTGALAHVPAVGVSFDNRRSRIVATRGSKEGKVRLDIVTSHLYSYQKLLPRLRDYAEHTTLRAPRGSTLPYQTSNEAKQVLVWLPSRSVVLDPVWTNLIKGHSSASS